MFTSVNPTDNVSVGRLMEYLSDRMPWTRSLWGIGVVLAMEELFEACEAMRHGHLSDGSIKRITSSLQKRVGVHPAFTETEKAFLRQHVQQVPRAGGVAHYAVRDLAERVTCDYLTRWGQVVATGNFKVEHFARSVAAHLLDAGFSQQYLHDFIKPKLGPGMPPITLSQLCDELQAMLHANPRRDFEALLAFTKYPEFPNRIPPSWLADAAAINAWHAANGFPVAGVRASCAMLITVQARDPVGAAQAARNESDRYAARALIATGKPLNRVSDLWIKGSSAPTPMSEVSRGVGVKELFREDRIFSAAGPNDQSVDAALELLAHLDGSSPAVAVAGGWGAIEGLLADPNDRATAADNLAALVTCSFARSELTSLAHHLVRLHAQECPDLVGDLSNRDRSKNLARMILENRMPVMRAMADKAAVERLKKLLANPARELQIIRDSIGDSFHRLYRQRNLILHGARLDSVALSASLRTVAKLAGAGMDRITHGHYVQGLKPLELVAKANLSLALVSRDSAIGCVDLLETS